MPTGEPKLPKNAADTFKKQCGVLVRDHVPISVREWNKRKGAADSDYVAERYKDNLWNDLMSHFNLPECENEDAADKLRAKVKQWTLKKMAELFRSWKKKLWKNYLKTKKVPVFEGYLAKQANHWKAFQEYKESEDAQALSEKNKINADKKKYHHKLGPGGYETAIPKWDKKEQDLLAKGIVPEPLRDEWELRARNWFLAHGGSYDEETGDLICSDGLRIPRENWKRIVKEIKEGQRKFTADRDKDLLTLVLGNDEHGGRTRGFGPSYPWWLGFARDQDTYRSRERAKKRQQDEENDKFNQLLARINEQQKQIDELRGVARQEDPALDITGAPSKRKSSVAESEAPPDDARRMIEGGPGYPVDGIKESTSCELHQKFKNISMKVAVGQALPSGPDARWHGREIPAGFAKVGVDEIMTGFNDMELDIAGPEDERTLGEVLGGVILWDKNYIKLPGSAPRTTPPPSRRRSPTPPLPPSPPHDVGQHNTSPSRSPPPDLGRPSPPPPAPDTKRKHSSKNALPMISKRRSPPKRKLSPLPKVPHANLPIRPYDRTPEENARIAKEHHDAQMKKKEPEPRPEYTEKQIAFAKYFTTLPSQYDLHHKPDDYTRTLQKEVKKSRSRASASGSKSSSTTSKKKSDVPQLGQQAKQSIPPLKVLTENVPPPVQGQAFERAKELADECGISVEDLLASQDDRIPKAVVAPKPQFVMGEPLVSKDDLPTNMRYLHKWYLSESKNGRTMIVLSVPREYYGRPEEIHIDFDELFQMYNGDALDKSLMSCYCL